MIAFSEPQALAFLTDPGTLKRGQELAKPAKWANLGRTAAAAWGECAGSGSKPYLTGIDLTEPAFKCSCPSRVFPCKHGAALLLLLARQADFPESLPPAWLAEWLEKRQQVQEKKEERAAAPKAAATADADASEAAADEAAAGPDVDPKRLARMMSGAADLAAWLEDLLRAGLATLDQQPPKFWEGQAARLVDNQLPGLAGTVRELATLRHAHADWPARLLGRLGELYLLVRAFQNVPNLTPDARLEVLQLVGISLKKEALLASAPPVADEWHVLGQHRWEEDRLTARRSWLHGRRTGQTALVLEFAFGTQPFATALAPGAAYRGELAFYPGRLPLRATPVALTYAGTSPPETAPFGQTINQLLDGYADALARQPWLREWPATLANVQPAPLPDGRWLLHHATEPGTLPLRFADENAGWLLLAKSGGQPVRLFGEWDGQTFRVIEADTATSETAGAGEVAEAGTAAETKVAAETSAAAEATAKAPAVRETSDASAPQTSPPDPALLLRAALLGTRQSAEALPAFPTAADSPEQQLLLAGGTLALMQKAGYQPLTATAPPPELAGAETRAALGPQGAAVLRQMAEQSLFLDMLPDYLARVGEAGRRVPAALLVPVLVHATRSTATAAQLGPVLGRRGQWLAALSPQWAKLLQKSADTDALGTDLSVWETGTLPERLAWLTRHFAHDADAARTLLLAALPTEPAKVQEALLELLADHLHPSAEPVLEALLKARGQEVRRLAPALLVRLPGAALTERLWARAAPLISLKRKLLGKNTLEATLPTAWDKAWLLDGIEEKNARYLSSRGPNFNTPVGPATARLANLVALLPPGRWATHLGQNPAELLAAALASEWAVPLLPAWAESTLLHQDAAFAAAFVSLWFEQRPALEKAHCYHGIDWAALATLLPDTTRQQLILKPLLERVRRRDTGWMRDLNFVPAPWPRALSAAVLEVVAAKLAYTLVLEPPNTPPAESREMAWLLPQTVAPYLAPADAAWAIQQVEAIPQVNDIFKSQLYTFVETLRFQTDLTASLHE